MQKYQSRSYRKGGGGEERQLPPWTYWTRHIKSVDGFVFFRLSYFNYSDLQLFAIFIFDVDFSETYPWQVQKIAFRSTPRPPYKARAFGTSDNAPP